MEEQPRSPDAMSAGGLDKRRLQHFNHARAHVADENRKTREHQRGHGNNQVRSQIRHLSPRTETVEASGNHSTNGERVGPDDEIKKTERQNEFRHGKK